MPFCLLLLLLHSGQPGSVHAESFSELEVRAVYLYNFAAFVDWPAASFETPTSPLRYCVLGTPALQTNVKRVLEGESVGDRPLELAPVNGPEDWRTCHLLYFDHSTQVQASRILSAARGTPVLTVSDSEAFARRGGMIGLVRKGERLRTFINRDAVTAAGIRISSKLLRISTLVEADREPAPP